MQSLAKSFEIALKSKGAQKPLLESFQLASSQVAQAFFPGG